MKGKQHGSVIGLPVTLYCVYALVIVYNASYSGVNPTYRLYYSNSSVLRCQKVVFDKPCRIPIHSVSLVAMQ